MEHKHLDAATLERLLASDRTTEQTEQLFHLLAVCPRCREVGGWLLELHQANALPLVFGPVDAVLARSRAEAHRLLEEMLPLVPDERLARVHADPRFVSWGLCELLVRRSYQTAPEQPPEAVHLADLAVHVADRIADYGFFDERWVYQLRSLAWAALGNARRVQGDLTAAEWSFDMSDSWWEAGTVDSEDALGYEPILLDLKASMRLAQRRFPEAVKLLDTAVKLFLHGEHRDPHLAGRSLISKALLLTEMGETESALKALSKANRLIDPEREPRLLLCIRHNLAYNLSEAGRYREADALLPDLKDLAAAHGSAKDRVRLDWVEGRVAVGFEDHARARRLLTQVRRTFLDEGNAFDAALAGLDLSISHLQEGKAAEVRARKGARVLRKRRGVSAASEEDEAASSPAASAIRWPRCQDRGDRAPKTDEERRSRRTRRLSAAPDHRRQADLSRPTCGRLSLFELIRGGQRRCQRSLRAKGRKCGGRRGSKRLLRPVSSAIWWPHCPDRAPAEKGARVLRKKGVSAASEGDEAASSPGRGGFFPPVSSAIW